MSLAHVAPASRGNAQDQQSTVQKLLDENSRLIDIIQEYQNQVIISFLFLYEIKSCFSVPCRRSRKAPTTFASKSRSPLKSCRSVLVESAERRRHNPSRSSIPSSTGSSCSTSSTATTAAAAASSSPRSSTACRGSSCCTSSRPATRVGATTSCS